MDLNKGITIEVWDALVRKARDRYTTICCRAETEQDRLDFVNFPQHLAGDFKNTKHGDLGYYYYGDVSAIASLLGARKECVRAWFHKRVHSPVFSYDHHHTIAQVLGRGIVNDLNDPKTWTKYSENDFNDHYRKYKGILAAMDKATEIKNDWKKNQIMERIEKLAASIGLTVSYHDHDSGSGI